MGRSALWFPAGTTVGDLDRAVTLDDGSPEPMFVMKGATGIEAPSWNVELQTTPGVRGARYIGAVSDPRSIKLPIHLCAPTRPEMRRIKEELLDAINPDTDDAGGQGVLMLSDAVGEDSGEYRCIDAVYAGGLEGDEASIKVGDRQVWWEFELQFTGLDFWYSPEPVIAEWAGQAGVPFFPFNISAWRLSPYGLTNTIPLDLGGNAKSWPTLTLSPPFSRIRVVNTRSGSWWQIGRGGDDEGAAVLVDGTPGAVRVRDSAGGNLFRQLTWDGSDPFGIRPGDSLTVESDGAAQSTRVHLEVVPHWKSAP